MTSNIVSYNSQQSVLFMVSRHACRVNKCVKRFQIGTWMQRKLFVNFPLLRHLGCPLQHAGSWQEGMLLGETALTISATVLWYFMGTLADTVADTAANCISEHVVRIKPLMWVGTSSTIAHPNAKDAN